MDYLSFENQYKEIEERVVALKKYLFENPEIGGEENLSIKALTGFLEDFGFAITADYADVKSAFRAVYKGKNKGAVVAIIAEPDALPNIGHGCGHNFISSAAVAAAVLLRESVDELGGEVSLFCTPGEENLCTKIDILKNGGFDGVDIALMVHPLNKNISSGKTLAIESLQIDFFGRSAHAGIEPEKGVNALDAAVLCYNIIATGKQYFKGSNIYGIISNGGEKASVIPDKSSLKYLCRTKSYDDLKEVREFIERSALSAAKATGCTVNVWNNEPTNKDMRTNEILSDIFNKHMRDIGGIEMIKEDTNGSTDMGDLSYLVPSIHPWVAITDTATALHTEDFANLTVNKEADLAMKNASLALVATATEVLGNPEILKTIKEEFN